MNDPQFDFVTPGCSDYAIPELLFGFFTFAPQGFEKTGLGQRIANLFVKAMGKSTLGLAIGLNIAETLLAPAMPSTSARAGGIFMPIIKSLSEASGSYPGTEEWTATVCMPDQGHARSGARGILQVPYALVAMYVIDTSI